MSEISYLPVSTVINTAGGSISVFTFYDGGDVNSIVDTFLSENQSSVGTVVYIEGELIVILRTDNQVSMYIDDNGDLILDSSDSGKYYISDNGDIFYDSSL